jgi:hypothetical protein
MSRPGREETQRLYGRRRVPRNHRRILVALLAADEVYAQQLMQLAQAPPGATTIVLARMQARGWVEMIYPAVKLRGRMRYRLTGTGRACAKRLVGLDPNPWPALAEAKTGGAT